MHVIYNHDYDLHKGFNENGYLDVNDDGNDCHCYQNFNHICLFYFCTLLILILILQVLIRCVPIFFTIICDTYSNLFFKQNEFDVLVLLHISIDDVIIHCDIIYVHVDINNLICVYAMDDCPLHKMAYNKEYIRRIKEYTKTSLLFWR